MIGFKGKPFKLPRRCIAADIKKCLHNLAVNWQVEIFFTCCTRRKDLNRREHHSIFERFRAQGDGLILCKDAMQTFRPSRCLRFLAPEVACNRSWLQFYFQIIRTANDRFL